MEHLSIFWIDKKCHKIPRPFHLSKAYPGPQMFTSFLCCLDNKFALFQVIFDLQYMMRFYTVFKMIYRIVLGHSCLKIVALISKCLFRHLKKPKIMLLVELLFSIGTIIFEKIICRMYKCDKFEITDHLICLILKTL